MKIEITATVDGKPAVTAEINDGAFAGLMFHPAMITLIDEIGKDRFADIAMAINQIGEQVNRKTKYEPMPFKVPKTVIVGDTVTEPGTYEVITQDRATGRAIGNKFHRILASGDKDAIQKLQAALEGIDIPDPPAPEETATQNNEAPDSPADQA